MLAEVVLVSCRTLVLNQLHHQSYLGLQEALRLLQVIDFE